MLPVTRTGVVASEGTAGWEGIKLRRWSRNSRVQAELKSLARCAAAGNGYLSSYPINAEHVCVVCVGARIGALKHINWAKIFTMENE